LVIQLVKWAAQASKLLSIPLWSISSVTFVFSSVTFVLTPAVCPA
jgi:hypothetical protein